MSESLSKPGVIELTDAAAPDSASAEYGVLRTQVLDALLLGRPAEIPKAAYDDIKSWADEILQTANGDPIGLSMDGLPDQMFSVLRWAGVPFSAQGSIKWGLHVKNSDVDNLSVQDDCLIIPSAEKLSHLTSLALRPLRHYFGKCFNVRLQAATAISCYLWSNQAVLVSCALVRAGGFLYGPDVGQRASLAIEPGASQMFNWFDND